MIIIAAQEAIRAVPPSYRFGAYALGATRWQAISRQVLPQAFPGIMTGTILALSRAIGETAPLIVIGAVGYVAFLPAGPLDAFTVLPIQIYDWIGRPQAEFHELAASAIVVLLLVLLSMNAGAILAAKPFPEVEGRMTDSTTEATGGSIITPPGDAVLETEGLWVRYGDKAAVKDITLKIPRKQVVAFIGPSGCGKSTLLRCFNRMNDLVPAARVEGAVRFRGESLYGPDVDPVDVRRRIGMVFQKPNPFPKSIYDNVAFGARINGFKGDMAELVERSLRQAALWDEVKDRLHEGALGLSGGQQQRLVVARALAIEPEVILMDEPTSALDPIATQRIEELIFDLKEDYSVVIVTHNMQQAARISDFTAFLYMGELIEYGETDGIFTNPVEERTESYITGRFG